MNRRTIYIRTPLLHTDFYTFEMTGDQIQQLTEAVAAGSTFIITTQIGQRHIYTKQACPIITINPESDNNVDEPKYSSDWEMVTEVEKL